jgi:hypothetical protein
LRSRGPHGWALGSIQHSELNTGLVSSATHNPAQRIDLSHYRAFGHSTDSRIAGHLTDGVEILRKKEGPRSPSSSERRGFRSGMTTADYNDVVVIQMESLLATVGAQLLRKTLPME